MDILPSADHLFVWYIWNRRFVHKIRPNIP